MSLSETTDGGMTISSSFMLMNENAAAGDLDAGFTLAFTDGSKLDLINAGNASSSHDISVPSSAGAEGITTATTNNAATGLDIYGNSTVFGFEYHTAADFLMDGLSVSVSASTDDGANNGSTYGIDDHMAIGATYVIAPGLSASLTSADTDSATTAGVAQSHTFTSVGLHVSF